MIRLLNIIQIALAVTQTKIRTSKDRQAYQGIKYFIFSEKLNFGQPIEYRRSGGVVQYPQDINT
jgi:hypothetical protein